MKQLLPIFPFVDWGILSEIDYLLSLLYGSGDPPVYDAGEPPLNKLYSLTRAYFSIFGAFFTEAQYAVRSVSFWSSQASAFPFKGLTMQN